MTLNPLQFAEAVKKQYLRYQLTSARLTDSILGDQLEDKLWQTDSRLFKGPFVSISRGYSRLHPPEPGYRELPTMLENEPPPPGTQSVSTGSPRILSNNLVTPRWHSGNDSFGAWA